MFTLKVSFEKETGLDAIDPLGDLTISDGISTITIETTYLDSWLAALVAGYNQTRESNHVTVEVSEEPQPLFIDVSPERLLSISYENQTLIPQPPKEVESALRSAAQSLVSAVDTMPDSQRNTFLDPIRKFISSAH